MIKEKLNKFVFIWGGVGLILIVTWAGLLFLIQRDKKVVDELSQNNQRLVASGAPQLSREKIKEINNYFVSDSSVVSLLEELESLGQKVGVKLTIGQPGEVATEFRFNLSTEGSFSATTKFLQALENLPAAVRVDRLELRKSSKVWQGVFILRVLKNNNV